MANRFAKFKENRFQKFVAPEEKPKATQNKTGALIDTVVDQVRQRLPLPENLPILGERIQGFGRFVRGLPQGIQRGLVGAVQAGADFDQSVVKPIREQVGLGNLITGDTAQNISRNLTDFQQFSDQRFNELNPSAEARIGSFVGEMIPATLATKNIPMPKSLSGRVGLGSGLGFGIGGSTFISPDDQDQSRLGRATTGAVFGGSIPLGIAGAQGVLNVFKEGPRNFLLNRTLGRAARRAAESQAGIRGEKVNKSLGEFSRGKVPVRNASVKPAKTEGGLTLGQRSGNPTLQVFEKEVLGSPRQLERVTPTLNKPDRNIVRALYKDFTKLRHHVKSPVMQRQVGRSLRVNYNRTIDILERKRSAQAKIDFGEVNRLSNNQKLVVPTKNTREALVDITREVEDIGKLTWAKTTANRMKKDGNFNLERLLRMRSRFSQWTATGDPNTKRIAGNAVKAIDKDIDALVGQYKGPLRDAIRKSIDNYKKFSRPINDIQSTKFGQVMDSLTDPKMRGRGRAVQVSDEVIAKKVLAMEPGEIRVAMPIIEGRGGTTADSVRFLYLKNMVRKNWGEEKASGAFRLDARGLAKSFEKDKDKFQALFPNPQKSKQVRMAFEAARLLGDPIRNSGVTSRPGTAMQDVGGSLASRNITFLIRYMAKYLPTGIYRDALYTEAGRKAMLTLAKPLKGQMVPLPALIQASKQLDREINKNRENNGN